MTAAAQLSNIIDPPPRLTGDPKQDTVAIIQWLSAFYVKGVLNNGLLQSANLSNQVTTAFPALSALGTPVDGEVPRGVMNGINKSFILAHDPGTSLFLFWNGAKQRVTIDYTLVGTALTMVLAPNSGDSFEAYYRY